VVWIPVAVQDLKVKDPLKEELVHEVQLSPGDSLLIDNPDRVNKSTEVRIILIRKDPVEYAGAQTIDVVKQLPSLVTTRDLLLRVLRSPAKGRR